MFADLDYKMTWKYGKRRMSRKVLMYLVLIELCYWFWTVVVGCGVVDDNYGFNDAESTQRAESREGDLNGMYEY